MSENEEVKTEPSLEDQIKAAAGAQGWHEGGKNEDGETVSAFEFIKRGSEFHKNLRKQNDDLKSQVDKLYTVVAENIYNGKKKEHAEEVSKVQTELRAAAEVGDADKVIQLTNKMQTIKEPDPIEADPKLQVVEQWSQKNQWFNSSEDMRFDALGFYQSEKTRLGVDDPEKILPRVEERIKKMYPDYFTPKNDNRARASGDAGTKVKRARDAGLSKDDLDEDERAHFDQFVGMGLKEKDLLKHIDDQRKRRGI